MVLVNSLKGLVIMENSNSLKLHIHLETKQLIKIESDYYLYRLRKEKVL